MTEQVQPIAPSRRLDVLDYLRFVAAGVVLAYHYTFNGINNGKIVSIDDYWPIVAVTKYGYLGVELFFLISGFVIFNSARGKTAREFAVGRAVRLYPAFWTAVFFTATVTALAGGITGLYVTVKQVLVNLTMVPSALGVASVDGVYWTLLLELEFYAAVFLLLLVGMGPRLGTLMPYWAFLMFGISVVAPSMSEAAPLLGGYFSLFAGGALIAEIRQSGPSALRVLGLLASAGTSLPFAYRMGQDLEVAKGVPFNGWVPVVVVAVFYLAILAMCSARVAGAQLPHARSLGALTYPLYLVHAHVGYIALSHFATEENRLWVYPLVIAGVLAVAYLINRIVERRLLSMWFTFFDQTVGRVVGWISPRPTAGRRVLARSSV